MTLMEVVQTCLGAFFVMLGLTIAIAWVICRLSGWVRGDDWPP